jgi:hypothetical protein
MRHQPTVVFPPESDTVASRSQFRGFAGRGGKTGARFALLLEAGLNTHFSRNRETSSPCWLVLVRRLHGTAKHKVATPVNWQQGEDVIIAGSVSDEEAKETYPQGWKAPRPYLRIVPQPR